MSPERLLPQVKRIDVAAADAAKEQARRLWWKKKHETMFFYLHDPPHFHRGPDGEEGKTRADRLGQQKERGINVPPVYSRGQARRSIIGIHRIFVQLYPHAVLQRFLSI